MIIGKGQREGGGLTRVEGGSQRWVTTAGGEQRGGGYQRGPCGIMDTWMRVIFFLLMAHVHKSARLSASATGMEDTG